VGWFFGGLGAAGEEEAPGRSPSVDSAPDQVPEWRVALPLVDQDRALGGVDHRGIRDQDLALPRVVEFEDNVGSPGRRRRLADTPSTLEGERGQLSHEDVEFLVSDPTLVIHRSTLPFARQIRYHLPPRYTAGYR
jgi:hypothetical protein